MDYDRTWEEDEALGLHDMVVDDKEVEEKNEELKKKALEGEERWRREEARLQKTVADQTAKMRELTNEVEKSQKQVESYVGAARGCERSTCAWRRATSTRRRWRRRWRRSSASC